MSNKLKQLQTLIEQKKYSDCVEQAQRLIQQEGRNMGALLIKAQAQIGLKDDAAAQITLNELYSKLNRGPEDAIFYQALLVQDQIAIALQTGNYTAAQKKQGRAIQISNKFQIVDFLDKKKKFDKMLEEAEIYILLLREDGNYKEVENNYCWLMKHPELSNEIRVSYGARIPDIDEYYKPYTKFDWLFDYISQLSPQHVELRGLGIKLLESFDNQSLKKTLLSVAQAENPQNVKDFSDFCQNLIKYGFQVFSNVETILKTPVLTRMFVRYIGALLLSQEFLSERWTEKVEHLKFLCLGDSFTNQPDSKQKSQVKLLLFSIIDVTNIVQKGTIPQFSDLLVSQTQSISELQDLIEQPNSEIHEVSPYVNAYLAICHVSKQFPFVVEPASTLARIKQAQYLWQKQDLLRLSKPQKTQNLTIYLDCLKLILKPDNKEAAEQTFKQAQKSFEKYQEKISKQIESLYLNLTTEMKWKTHLQNGEWIQAIKCLDQLAELHPEKLNFATVKKCEIQLQNIDKICDTQEQKDTQIMAIFNTLQSYQESDSLLIQGFILYENPKLFGQDQKIALNKWLLALKKDQTNALTFYSLGVYYFGIGDQKKAFGCLDKALKLNGGFEEALVLQYYLLDSFDQRQIYVERFMETNRNSAVSYFFKGLIMQQKQDFIQAIDMFQNAMKFYTIAKQRQNGTKNLIPKAALQIFDNPFGIFGQKNATVCWVYLSECFYKIEKPTVALKCFSQGIQELSQNNILNLSNNKVSDERVANEVMEILKIIDYSQLYPNKLEVSTDPILRQLSELQPSQWALECLMLGARYVQSPAQSISILHVALKCLPQSNVPRKILGFIVTELIDKVASLIKQGVVIEDGQAKLYVECKEMITRLVQLVDFCNARPEFSSIHNLQKKILTAYFVIAQRTHEQAAYKRAMDKANQLVALFEGSKLQKYFMLDTCKVIHEYQLFENSEELQQRKISLIRKAILLEPMQANLWVHLHLFSTDENTKARAIFKAYELEPESSFVQENMIRFYLKTKNWSKAFKILVRSYQQATNNNQAQQPIVIATLAYLNAICYFQFGRKEQLFEALSLIRMIQREDMQKLLNELFVYLRHFSGDFVTTLSYFQQNKGEQHELLLLKAQLGSQLVSDNKVAYQVSVADQAVKFIQDIFEIDKLPNDVVRTKCENYIQLFLLKPVENAQMLALMQELCLQRGLLINKLVIDTDAIKPALNQLTQGMQRIILIQSLRLLQLREGKIPEASTIIQSDGTEQKIVVDRSYTGEIFEASRLKPQYLTTAQHQALLRLFLNAQLDESLLKCIYNREGSTQDRHKTQGLKQILQLKSQNLSNGQRHLMQNPLSIEANTKWIWSLLRAGKIEQAHLGHEVLQKKFQMGILQGDQSGLEKLSQFITLIKDKQIGDHNHCLGQIQNILANLGGQKDTKEEGIREIAAKIIQVIISTQSQDQAQLTVCLCQTLQLVLFSQGHLVVYTKLLKELVYFAEVAKLFKQNGNILWCFQLLTTCSALLSQKKYTQINPLCKDATNLLQNGHQKRSELPVSLIQARMNLSLNNLAEVQKNLNIDNAILERDIMVALSFYSQQDYKEYYLTCKGLVAGAKASQTQHFKLAYCYYLKAFAEMTFYSARKMGFMLKDDFAVSDAEFNQAYFLTKAQTSIQKCKTAILISMEGHSLLKEAIEVMESQLKE